MSRSHARLGGGGLRALSPGFGLIGRLDPPADHWLSVCVRVVLHCLLMGLPGLRDELQLPDGLVVSEIQGSSGARCAVLAAQLIHNLFRAHLFASLNILLAKSRLELDRVAYHYVSAFLDLMGRDVRTPHHFRGARHLLQLFLDVVVVVGARAYKVRGTVA